MKDFLGCEYGIGDHVVYPSMSGRSVTMTHGVVTAVSEFDNGPVQIRPLDSARWKNHYGRNRYRNIETGDIVTPKKARLKDGHRRHRDTGQELSTSEYYDQYNHLDRADWISIEETLKPGFEKVNIVSPVTVHNTENIVKVAPPS